MGKNPAVAAKGLPRIVEVGSTTCIPCKTMTPILKELSKTYKGKLIVESVDFVDDRAAAQRYGVRVIPTQILFDGNGREISRHVGVYPKVDILAEFKEHGIDLEKEIKHE